MDTRKIVAAVKHLAQMDPQDAAVARTVQVLNDEAALLRGGEVERPDGFKGSFGESSAKADLEAIGDQIKKLHSAAAVPARNYARMASILAGLHRAHEASGRPAYAHLRPRIAGIIEKVAGVFAEIDTVQDLEKPLEAIEKAVHGLYGDQGKNATFYFERRNKGHHGEGK
jgi:hypothetical protein